MRGNISGYIRAAVLAVIFLMIIMAMLGSVAVAKSPLTAYFNGREATVSNVTLKVGEPFDVDVYYAPDYDTRISVKLWEVGTEDAYGLVSGDKKGETIRQYCNASCPAHFHWVLAANGQWTDGNAPVNIVYKLWGDGSHPEKNGEFTVVDTFISPEHYQSPKAAGSAMPLAPGLEAVPVSLFIAYAIAGRKKSRLKER